MENLRPCSYRLVDDLGQILCSKIRNGDRQVSPSICRACPIAEIECAHLRATLANDERPSIVVRFGNGRSEVWEGEAPKVSLLQAACALKVIPVQSTHECVGCLLRKAPASTAHIHGQDRETDVDPLQSTPSSRYMARRERATAANRGRTLFKLPPDLPQPATPAAQAFSTEPAPGKIIRMAEWLETRMRVSTCPQVPDLESRAVRKQSRSRCRPREESLSA